MFLMAVLAFPKPANLLKSKVYVFLFVLGKVRSTAYLLKAANVSD